MNKLDDTKNIIVIPLGNMLPTINTIVNGMFEYY